MGYTTEFYGKFELNKELDQETFELLNGLSKTRRMKRNILKMVELGLAQHVFEFGTEGEFYYNKDDFDNFGQTRDDSIIDYNLPPKTQPGLWLQWISSEDKKSIIWDGGEKFYYSREWLIYIIEKILAPKGYILNGFVNCQGEDENDKWSITVKDNLVD